MTAPTVFIVEDDPDTREMLGKFLELEGFHVETAANGRQALDRLSSGLKASVIVLDLMMPIMDGWQFLGLLGNYLGLANIPVLIVSGHPVHLDRLTHQAIVGCLHPPYPLDELVNVVSLYNAPAASDSAPQRSSG